jgi:hypothetical protein
MWMGGSPFVRRIGHPWGGTRVPVSKLSAAMIAKGHAFNGHEIASR